MKNTAQIKKITLILSICIFTIETSWFIYTKLQNKESQNETDIVLETENKNSEKSNKLLINKKRSASLSMSSDSEQIQNGEEFSVEVSLNSTSPVDAVDSIINYDPEYLNITKIVLTKDFSDTPLKKIDPIKKQIMISQNNNKDKVIQGKITIATLKITPIKAGNTQLEFSFNPNDTTDSNVIPRNESIDILSSANSLNLSIK